MAVSRKIKIVLCCVLGLLFIMAICASPWLLTELTIRKILRNPKVPLSQKEVTRIIRYLEGDRWHRWPGSSVSQERQAKLVDAAIERLTGPEEAWMLLYIANEWHAEGSFPTLPHAVGKVILRRRAGVSEIVLTVGQEDRSKTIDPYIDVDFVMASEDSKLILSCLVVLQMRTLYENRNACLEMLKREDILPACKKTLLGRIAAEGTGVKWFAGKEDVLRSLQVSDNQEVRAAVERVLQLIQENRVSK